MRFVELRPILGGEGFRLHPRITFLRGLDPAARVAVVGLVHDVALGDRPDWEGVAEIDGVELPLADAVRKMGETAQNALILTAANLPASAGPGDADPSDAVRAHADAVARLAELDQRVTGLADELAASGRLRSDMKARLASAEGRVDDSTGRELDLADGELGRRARLADRPDPWTGMDGVEARVEALRKSLIGLEGQLAALPSGDRPALAAAVATARASLSSGEVPDPDAAALAQAWTSLHQRLVGLESRMEASGGGTEAVAARLDAARAAARAAEDAAVPRSVLPEEEEHLERLHDEMIAAEGKVGRGLRRGAAKAGFDRAAAALQAVLDPLGYPTWAAFRMGNGMASVLAEALVEYERAGVELETAEMEWAELMARLERDTELQDVLLAIERALEDAIEILGTDRFEDDDHDLDVVSDALRTATVDAASLVVAAPASVAHLRRTLDEAGALGHGEIRAEAGIVALGDTWLLVLEAADSAAVRILRDQERAKAELAALEELGDASRVDRLGRERKAMHEAERAVAETREALTDIVRARLELHMLAATELALAEEHDDHVTRQESACLLLELATRRLEGGPSLDAAAKLAPRVPRGMAGPIPMVVVMGAVPASALDVLTAIPADIQVIVVGEGTGIDEWVAEVGSEVAMSLDVSALV